MQTEEYESPEQGKKVKSLLMKKKGGATGGSWLRLGKKANPPNPSSNTSSNPNPNPNPTNNQPKQGGGYNEDIPLDPQSLEEAIKKEKDRLAMLDQELKQLQDSIDRNSSSNSSRHHHASSSSRQPRGGGRARPVQHTSSNLMPNQQNRAPGASNRATNPPQSSRPVDPTTGKPQNNEGSGAAAAAGNIRKFLQSKEHAFSHIEESIRNAHAKNFPSSNHSRHNDQQNNNNNQQNVNQQQGAPQNVNQSNPNNRDLNTNSSPSRQPVVQIVKVRKENGFLESNDYFCGAYSDNSDSDDTSSPAIPREFNNETFFDAPLPLDDEIDEEVDPNVVHIEANRRKTTILGPGGLAPDENQRLLIQNQMKNANQNKEKESKGFFKLGENIAQTFNPVTQLFRREETIEDLDHAKNSGDMVTARHEEKAEKRDSGRGGVGEKNNSFQNMLETVGTALLEEQEEKRRIERIEKQERKDRERATKAEEATNAIIQEIEREEEQKRMTELKDKIVREEQQRLKMETEQLRTEKERLKLEAEKLEEDKRRWEAREGERIKEAERMMREAEDMRKEILLQEQLLREEVAMRRKLEEDLMKQDSKEHNHNHSRRFAPSSASSTDDDSGAGTTLLDDDSDASNEEEELELVREEEDDFKPEIRVELKPEIRPSQPPVVENAPPTVADITISVSPHPMRSISPNAPKHSTYNSGANHSGPTTITTNVVNNNNMNRFRGVPPSGPAPVNVNNGLANSHTNTNTNSHRGVTGSPRMVNTPPLNISNNGVNNVNNINNGGVSPRMSPQLRPGASRASPSFTNTPPSLRSTASNPNLHTSYNPSPNFAKPQPPITQKTAPNLSFNANSNPSANNSNSTTTTTTPSTPNPPSVNPSQGNVTLAPNSNPSPHTSPNSALNNNRNSGSNSVNNNSSDSNNTSGNSINNNVSSSSGSNNNTVVSSRGGNNKVKDSKRQSIMLQQEREISRRRLVEMQKAKQFDLETRSSILLTPNSLSLTPSTTATAPNPTPSSNPAALTPTATTPATGGASQSSAVAANNGAKPESHLCGGCNIAVTGTTISALGKKWHPEHFTCAKCKQPMRSFVTIKDRALCSSCFNLLKSAALAAKGSNPNPSSNSPSSNPNSNSNSNPSTSANVSANNNTSSSANPSPVSVKREEDGKESSRGECEKCKEEIGRREGYVLVLGKPWHKECFVCSKCQKQLKAFVIKGGVAYCRECYAELPQTSSGGSRATPRVSNHPPDST